ncbi:MAG: transglutaminase family protein [Pseudomonadota bacterium]|nr:transglutaminase family protein [Pseudomonadota bacterium]
MHLTIIHDTQYRYDEAATLIVQALRMWPSASPGQTVKSWQVQVDGRPIQPTCVDGFGNPVATHAVDKDVVAVRLSVRGQVVTEDRHGVHGDPAEPLPPMYFLAGTDLTAETAQIRDLAEGTAGEGSDLERLHRLSNAVRDHVDYRSESTDSCTTAGEAFAAGAGVCQDHAHVLISAARSLGYPARYVSGYLCPLDASTPAASHAWAEVFVEDLGWVGFDAANRLSPDERYVRIASGRDYRDAAPVRGVRLGGIAETLDVTVDITETAQRGQRNGSSQSQSQSAK